MKLRVDIKELPSMDSIPSEPGRYRVPGSLPGNLVKLDHNSCLSDIGEPMEIRNCFLVWIIESLWF
jgi:hypothetical protein